MKKYEVTIDDEIWRVKRIDKRHPIWMCHAPREKPINAKPGIYILTDDSGNRCYVGETDNFKRRMQDHKRKLRWWAYTIYFWEDDQNSAFLQTDDRYWYEKHLKESVETKHKTVTQRVHNRPEPNCGREVLKEMLDLLEVIKFDAEDVMESSDQIQRNLPMRMQCEDGRAPEPIPHRNHRPPLGDWPTYTALAHAIAEKNGSPGTAGGIQQKLTNFWAPGRGRYCKANTATRQMLESYGVAFDMDGFVKSCANVPFPLQHQ